MASFNISSPSVAMIEQDNLVGLYVTHNQQLDLHSVQMDGPLGTVLQQQQLQIPPSPTKRTAKGAAVSNGSSKSNGHQSNHQQQHFRRFELNSKLFAINEPYLMKTERESLVQQLLTDQAAAATATEEVAKLKKAQNGTAAEAAASIVTASKTVANRTRKRKKALTKKVAYLDQNLASDEERRLAMALIQRCLLPSVLSSSELSSPSSTTTTLITASPNNKASASKKIASPSKRKTGTSSLTNNSITTTTSSATSSTNSTIINKDNLALSATPTTAEQLLRVSLQAGDSNQEAQSFVGGLFRNRFESLNYRGKVFCNPYGRVLRAKIGLSSYLIPARCSFAGADICEGLQALKKEIIGRRVTLAGSGSSNSSSSTSFSEPFYVLLDPAWDNNKSVKRKKSYETVSLDYLRRMCRDLKELIEVVLQLKREQQQQSKKNGVDKGDKEDDDIQKPPPPPPVVIAIWTTKADKDFVFQEMLPILQASATYELKWHKVTITGCPVKVHGGLEYLLVAERWWTVDNVTTTNDATPPTSLRSGLLVSVPSAVHSHKPTPVPVLRKLYGLLEQPLHRSNSNSSSVSYKSSPENNGNDQRAVVEQFSYGLAESEVISPLVGVELFARYLQSGFHSIGYECIKLQNEELFTSRIVQ